MDPERLLISRVASAGGIEKLLTEGVDVRHFEDETCRSIWTFMTEHLRKYRSQPSLPVLREQFPTHDFTIVPDSLDYCYDQFIRGVKRRFAIEGLRRIGEILDDDPERVDKVDELFLESGRELAMLLPTAGIGRFSDMKSRIEEYDLAAANAHLQGGIRMGIPLFDDLTMGIQEHEYLTIAGWQGTGKSTLAQWMMLNAYQQDRVGMYISLEMGREALFRKWDTMVTNFKYNHLKSLTLSPEDRKRWMDIAQAVEKRKTDIIVLDDVRNCSVDRVYAEIVKHKPDIVCVDYITLMDLQAWRSSQLWERVTYLTQSLKATARTLKVPIIGVAQTNAESRLEGANLGNLSYSRSIGQDSDIVMGLHRTDEMRQDRQMQVKLLKNRDGAIGEELLRWDMDVMEFRPWKESDRFTPSVPFSRGAQGATP